MIERREHGEPPTHRPAHEMGAVQAEGVEQADRIHDQITEGVWRSTRLVADRSAGIPVVVADEESGACRETLTELLLPREQRGGRSVDKQDRGVGGIAEGLDAEVDPVGPDYFVVRLHGPNLEILCGWPLSV